MKQTKYIFVTGGVVSGLGKGITAASLGRLLKARGLKVFAQKLDPYINVDPGMMNPLQHGEVFVTDDGAETDLDLGHYERFIDENLGKFSTLTSGKVYWNVLNKERKGDYPGETIQVIPHITGTIKEFIYSGAQNAAADVIIIEIGGTVGDIESQPFLEAIRQVSAEAGRENCLFIHVTLVPYLRGSDEHKSKPTQHSARVLQSLGITPNIIITRSDERIEEGVLRKIALFCNVKPDCVIQNMTQSTLYEVPMMLHAHALDAVVCRELHLQTPEPDLSQWQAMLERIASRSKTVKIAIVGKYVRLRDAYISVSEALLHAGFECGAKVDIVWIDSETITPDNAAGLLEGCGGILVPGGFDVRGIEGKIAACQYARESDIPYLGICLGLQVAVIEYARNVCGIKDATSKEFSVGSANFVIDLMPEQLKHTQRGGTMRLGSYPCEVKPGTVLHQSYQQDAVSERHRHRYEFNNAYKPVLESGGLMISGTSSNGEIVEAIELPDKRFFVGVQFHPEFKSRPNRAHPLFLAFVAASCQTHASNQTSNE